MLYITKICTLGTYFRFFAQVIRNLETGPDPIQENLAPNSLYFAHGVAGGSS